MKIQKGKRGSRKEGNLNCRPTRSTDMDSVLRETSDYSRAEEPGSNT